MGWSSPSLHRRELYQLPTLSYSKYIPTTRKEPYAKENLQPLVSPPSLHHGAGGVHSPKGDGGRIAPSHRDTIEGFSAHMILGVSPD